MAITPLGAEDDSSPSSPNGQSRGWVTIPADRLPGGKVGVNEDGELVTSIVVQRHRARVDAMPHRMLDKWLEKLQTQLLTICKDDNEGHEFAAFSNHLSVTTGPCGFHVSRLGFEPLWNDQ